MDGCQLPAGPSGQLADLSAKLNNMGKEKSRDNALHLGSDQPANTFTVQPAPWLSLGNWATESLKILHKPLWLSKQRQSWKVFRHFQHPSWNPVTNPHINSDDTRTTVKLMLSHITKGNELL